MNGAGFKTSLVVVCHHPRCEGVGHLIDAVTTVTPGLLVNEAPMHDDEDEARCFETAGRRHGWYVVTHGGSGLAIAKCDSIERAHFVAAHLGLVAIDYAQRGEYVQRHPRVREIYAVVKLMGCEP